MAPRGQMGLEVFPADLDTEPFRAAWSDWLADRAERRLPRYTARARDMQLKRLAALGPARAVAAIEWSIAQGYKGIFESPDVKAAKTVPETKAPPSVWELRKKLDLIEERTRFLRSKSPGDHCSLADFLSAAERAEYAQLSRRAREIKSRLME
jgi:hypothetical protein